jgi:AcrR family transcriptional regulator
MNRGARVSTRKPRADAERNRARVLEAAHALFAERGEGVQLPDVAREAGVGMGTVYRHFPTRQDLVEAAAEERFARIAAFAETDCLLAPDPLVAYLHHVGEVLSANRGLSAAIETARRSPGSEPRGESRARLETAVRRIIEVSAVRDDASVGDVYMIVGALSATVRTGSGDWRRFIDLALHGLTG